MKKFGVFLETNRQMFSANQSPARSTGDNFFMNLIEESMTSAKSDGSQIYFDTSDVINEPGAHSSGDNIYKKPIKESMTSVKSDGLQMHFDTFDSKNEPSELSACNKHLTTPEKSDYHATQA